MKKRDHVPALKGSRLQTALRAVEKLPLNKRAKEALQRMLVEATLPERDDPEHSAGRQHGRNMKATQAALTGLTQAKMAGAARLIAGDVSDDDWLAAMEKRLGGQGGA